MKTRDGRLVNARFLDDNCDTIRAEFKNYETEAVSVNIYSFNPEDKFVMDILNEYSIEDLERNYVEFSKMEGTRQKYFERFVERFDEIVDYLDSGITPQAPAEDKPVTLQVIKDIGNSPEDFFKLKLEIFELPEVKNSKNRKWKASMRKASTTLELLSLLYEVYSTVENEQGERQDETPDQETATSQDSAS